MKLFIFWHTEQEFMVRCGDSLSMTFRCSNRITVVTMHCCLRNVYTYDLNHHLQATGVGCCVGGSWVNSLRYADDMVLLAPKGSTWMVALIQTFLKFFIKSGTSPCDEKRKQTVATQVVYLKISNIFVGTVSMWMIH